MFQMVEAIVVKRSVYDAAQIILGGRELDEAKPFPLVAKKMEECQAAADKSGYRFWGEVYNFLIQVKYMNLPVKIIESC